MKKSVLIVVAILTAALVLSACGGAAPAPGNAQVAPTEAGQPAAISTEKPAEKATAAPVAVDTAEPATPEALELSDVTAGLGDLNSYKASFSMTFEGKDDSGQTKASTMAFTEEFVKEPAAKRTTVTGFGAMMGGSSDNSNSSAGAIESIEIGGKQYSKMGDICTQITAESGPQANTMMDPNSIIGSVRGAQRVGNETINGVPAVHYKIDVTGLEIMGYLNGDGDVWVAEPGNYVVKYTFQATGKDKFFGSSSNEGTIKWDYEVTDVNQPISIQAPADCSGAAEDIPMMADAQDQASMGTMSTYSTPSTFADVVAFYEKEMKAQGWTAQDEGGMSTDGMVMKNYTKDGRTVQIIVTADSGSDKTSVMITEEKK